MLKKIICKQLKLTFVTLFDNIWIHLYSNVYKKLNTQDIKLIDHPLCSPELPPTDSCLLNEIKHRLPNQMTLTKWNRNRQK